MLAKPQPLQDAAVTYETLFHGRRPADKDVCRVMAGLGGQNVAQQLPRHAALSVRRRRGRVTHDVDGPEAAWEAPLVVVELVLEEDVSVAVDAKDERHGRPVVGVPEDALGELEDGRDARAAGNESDVREHVWLPLVALEAGDEEEGLAGGERVEVGAGLAVGVLLDEQVQMPRIVWSAVSHDEVPSAIAGPSYQRC